MQRKWLLFKEVNSCHLSFVKQMGIPVHLTCLLRHLYAGQEATVGTEHGTTDWFQIEKRSFQVGSCHLSILFLLNIDYSWVQIFCLSFKIVSWVSLGATDGHWNQDTTVIITKDMKISFFSLILIHLPTKNYHTKASVLAGWKKHVFVSIHKRRVRKLRKECWGHEPGLDERQKLMVLCCAVCFGIPCAWEYPRAGELVIRLEPGRG